MALAALRGELLVAVGLFPDQKNRLRRRRIGPTLFAHRRRSAACHPRRRSNLDRQSPPDAPRSEKNPLYRSRARLGNRLSLGHVSLGRIRIGRRRPELATLVRLRRFSLVDRRFPHSDRPGHWPAVMPRRQRPAAAKSNRFASTIPDCKIFANCDSCLRSTAGWSATADL